MTTVMQSGYAYQIRYAIYRAVWIAAGRDPLAATAATIRLEHKVRDRTGKVQWIDIVIEDHDGRILEVIETKEHDGFLPLASVESFLRRADALRGVVPRAAHFRFVCNQKLTEGLDLSREVERNRALKARGVAQLVRKNVVWELGVWSKPSLVDRTMVLLARDGGDARDLYFQLHAQASAQIAMRRPSHADAASRDASDLLIDYYTSAEHRDPPKVQKEPGLSIENVRHAIGVLAREHPPVRRFAEERVERALRRPLFVDRRISTNDIFVEPLAGLTSPVHGTVTHHGGEATSLLFRWMNDLYEERAPREPLVLLGTFGVGKSTLLTSFAHALLRLVPWVTPLLVPLRDLVGLTDTSFRDELLDVLRRNYRVDFSLPPESDSLRYLLLCDGFDELNLYYSRKDVRDWVEGAYGVLRSLAQRRDTGVVVSSRPILFMEQQRRMRLTQPVLELAEFDEQRIDLWCANYRRVRRRVSAEFSYQFLRERQLDEVARTPIVLYMLALLYEDGWLKPKKYTNTDVYRTFVDWTAAGGYRGEEKHRLPANYREILRDIAWFIFQSAEERLPESTLLGKLRAKYGTVTSDHIAVGANLLVAHMLQPARGVDGEEKLIEFTHQSLREYLVAERLWQLTEPQRRGTPLTYAAWDEAAGARFTRAEVGFLAEMAAALPAKQALHLYREMQRVEDVAAALQESIELSRARGSELNLWTVAGMAVLAFILRVKLFQRISAVAKKRDLPQPPSDATLRILLDFTSAIAQQGSDVRTLLAENLSGLRLAPQAELTNIDLADAELRDVVLTKADLKRAVLPGVLLQSSVFTDCDFSHASIAAQYLFRTRFVGCNFTCAEIHIENELELGTTALNTFADCDFTNAVFTGLIVQKNTFVGCTWDGASVQAEEEAIVESSTLDAAAMRFFRSQKVRLRNCALVPMKVRR